MSSDPMPLPPPRPPLPQFEVTGFVPELQSLRGTSSLAKGAYASAKPHVASIPSQPLLLDQNKVGLHGRPALLTSQHQDSSPIAAAQPFLGPPPPLSTETIDPEVDHASVSAAVLAGTCHASRAAQEPKRRDTHRNLSFTFHNVRGMTSESRLEKHIQLCRAHRTFVSAAAETWRLGTEQLNNSEFLILTHGPPTKPCTRGSHGLAFFLSPDAQVAWQAAGAKVHTEYGLRIMAIRLQIKETKGKLLNIFLVQVWAPHSGDTQLEMDLFYEQLDACIDTCKSNEILILTGDYNASIGTRARGIEPHEDLVRGPHGLTHQNKRGHDLQSWLAVNGLCNATSFFRPKSSGPQTTWTHPGSKKGHQLDYFFVQRKDLKRVTHAHIFQCHIGSDHTAVRLKLRIRRTLKKNRCLCPECLASKPKYIDRSKLQVSELRQQYCSIVAENYNPSAACKFTSLQAAIKIADGRVCGSERPKQKGWFEARAETIMPLVSKRNSLQASFNRLTSNASTKAISDAKTQLTSARAGLRKEISVAKSKWVNELLDTINSGPGAHPKLFWDTAKLLKRGMGNTSPAVIVKMKKGDGALCETEAESAEVFRVHFDRLYNNIQPYEQSAIDSLKQRPVDEALGMLPTTADTALHIKRLNNGKAPGDNGIPAESYKALKSSPATLSIVTEIIQDFWRSGECYEEWLTGRLKLLPKKGDLSNPNNWRGIMLLDVAGKIVASIISERLQALLQKVGVESQNGFMLRRGCTDAIFSLKVALQKRKEHMQDSWVLFIDLVKAFDTVNRTALIAILRKFGVPNHLALLIERLHTDVKVKLKVGATDVLFEATIGVKQGDNMAPVLFLFYMQAAIEAMEQEWPVSKPEFRYKLDSKMTGRAYNTKGSKFDFWSCLYADDSALLFANRTDLTEGAQFVFSTLARFGLQMHIQGKTEAMYIPCRLEQYDLADTSNVLIATGFIPFTAVFRYLGTHVHHSLSDLHDVQHRITSAGAMFGSLKSTLCARQVKLTLKGKIYRTLVVSILLYGCEAWALTAETRRMLVSFHGRCVRRMHRITLEHTQKHQISTASLEEKLGISGIAGIIDDLCLRWAGHVARMDEARLPRRFLTSWVHAKRRTGRPYKSTIHRIQDTIRLTGAHLKNWVELAQDRGSWKDVVHGLAIEIGADGAEERCSRCKRDSTANRPLYVCDSHGCTAAWHAHCLPAHSRQLLVRGRWFCPNCEIL